MPAKSYGVADYFDKTVLRVEVTGLKALTEAKRIGGQGEEKERYREMNFVARENWFLTFLGCSVLEAKVGEL